jgi:hypothetical protein
MLVKKASDQYQASYEEAACLGSYQVDGSDAGTVIAKFINETTIEDTVA